MECCWDAFAILHHSITPIPPPSPLLSLLPKRPALDVGRDGAADQDENAFDEAPQAADAAREDRDDDLSDADANVAKIESVNAEVADENSQQTRDELGFAQVIWVKQGWDIWRREHARELGEGPERFPIRRAFRLREGLGVGAAFRDPLAELLDANRPVLPAIASDDSIHTIVLPGS